MPEDAFVAEVAVDLRHDPDLRQPAASDKAPVRSAKSVEIELSLWCVMNGRAAASSGDLLHHRGLDWEIAAAASKNLRRARSTAARLTKTSRTLRGASSGLDPVPCSGASAALWAVARVHEKVDIALAVPQLRVFKAVILVRQGQHGLVESDAGRSPRDRVHGKFGAGARPHQVAANANVVAEVEQLAYSAKAFSPTSSLRT